MSARIFCTSAVVAALALAGYRSIRLAAADWQFRANTRASVERAIALDPANARYHGWLAEMLEYEGGDPKRELELAAALNPADSAVRIRLGLLAESRRDFPRAEQLLLAAARLDKLYAPRWTLANYYARRGNEQQFWPWARQAMLLGFGELRPLFRLSATVAGGSIDPGRIPNLRDVRAKYLQFLIEEGGVETIPDVAREFIPQALADDAPLLARACDRLIERGLSAEAASLWREMCLRRLLPFDVRGLVTNGDFRAEPMQLGFDWRVSGDPEIAAARSESQRAMRLHLSGRQAERVDLLWQFVPLQPGRRYRFAAEYRTSWRDPAGVRLRLGETAESADLAAEEWTPVETSFTAAAHVDRLALFFARAAGSMRAEGEIWIRNVTLAPEN